MKALTKIFIFLVFIGLVAGGGLLYVLYSSGSSGGEAVELVIPRGASLGQVAHILEQNQIIANAKLFKYLLTFTRGSNRVRAGEFRFQKGMRYVDALGAIYDSDPIVHQVTLPEGWNVRQYAQILAKAQLIDEKKFLSLSLTKEAAAKYKVNAPSLEGFLYPDTYAFSRIDGEERIIDRLVRQFRQKFGEPYAKEIQEKGWTLERLVTLASVVEKETGVPGERPIIASVFHNRIKKKMRLQSDPTTIYGIENFNGNLTRADLLRYSPYNTYVIKELPIGPIANPGVDALVATLRPADSKFLYFVANNQGAHIFSETYEKHSRNVNDFQKNPASRRAARSAPPKKR